MREDILFSQKANMTGNQMVSEGNKNNKGMGPGLSLGQKSIGTKVFLFILPKLWGLVEVL